MKKNNKIINGTILYIPEEHRLSPLCVRGKENVLNVPTSRCLQLLLQRPGVVISQEEFFREVWKKNGQHITANTLYQNISLLRKGIREAGLTKNIIRTVPKVGVVFSGAVEIMDEESNNSVESPQIALPVNKTVETHLEQPTLQLRGKRKKFVRFGLMTAFITTIFILLMNNRYKR
ncbi:MAG: winged helix-turn-helix domain-containing protein [Serratia sp. (in: enterobacteria)]|uniref:winged helix-turn-helix domain-containing protein n=1 Tax=Serratia sp. (in: enterobacteria) TaxID=616 RepID=UPI003F382D62